MSHRFNSIKSKHSLFTILFSLQFLSVFPSLVTPLPPSLSGKDLFASPAASPITLDGEPTSRSEADKRRPTPLNFYVAAGGSPEEPSFSGALPQGLCRDASREFRELERALVCLMMASGSQDEERAKDLLRRVQSFLKRNAELIAKNGLFSDDPSASSKDACDRLLASAKSAVAMHGAVSQAAAATGKA